MAPCGAEPATTAKTTALAGKPLNAIAMVTAVKANLTCALLLVLLFTCSACSPSGEPSAEERATALEEVDYNFHVKPILAEHCFTCHGHHAESRKADLELHTEHGLFAALRDDSTRRVVVPGDPAKSELIRRITSPIAKDRMPPPEAPRALTEYQAEVLKEWVRQGAEWKPHWAFIPPSRVDIPVTRASNWARNPIDHFVLARLEREGLEPSREADRYTLIRRLYLDLTGLPPSSARVQAFVQDSRDDAVELLVDELLASPHFGERMAVFWLDLARFADTNGYSIDGGRHLWLWRDWVIHAFNENKPFDTFIIEQLAGDLLEQPTEAQLVATGFHRNHMITHEGGTIPEENLTNYVADRVKTTGEVFLGLTMACAQCHDHKYDPITQQDYYRFFAFFNTIEDRGLDGDAGVNALPSMQASTLLASEEEITAIREELVRLRATLASDHHKQPVWEESMRRELAERGRGLALHPVRVLKVTTPNSGYTGEILPDGSVFIGQPGGLAAYNVSLRLDGEAGSQPLSGLRIIFSPHPHIRQGSIGHGARLDGSFILTSVHVSKDALPSDQVDPHLTQPIRRVTASHAHPDYPANAALDERRINGWSPHPQNRSSQHITLTLEEPIDPTETPFVTVMLNFGAGDNLIGGHFRVLAMEGNDDGSSVPSDEAEILFTDPARRTSEAKERLRAFFAATSLQVASLRYQVKNLEERLDVLTGTHSTMVMNVAAKPRETFVLNRGQYDQPLYRVDPGVPSVLPPMSDGATASRLDLALWLTEKDHPLTARVAVNRFWQMLFGTGLVSTAADFGMRGALPSHPALLDWLAVEFINSDWNVKALLKQIVLSAAYRQQSITSDDLLAHDPQNRLLARGPRFRLQAEFIRDLALQVSGLMVPQLGGPSVHPYQPAGLWKEISHYGSTPATAQVFVQDHADKLYRRSLYTYWKRTAPPPSMLMFDAPTREVCTVTREVTNTPLQALVLLNDPQFVEASRAFAERVLLETSGDRDTRLRFAYQEVTGRVPDRATMTILRNRLEEELATFGRDPDRAQQYLSIGESPRSELLDTREHAAWMTVASLLLNLSETITRD